MPILYDHVPGAAQPRRTFTDRTVAEHEASELVGAYVVAGWRVVERVTDGAGWTRWVLRRASTWAAVEVKDQP